MGNKDNSGKRWKAARRKHLLQNVQNIAQRRLAKKQIATQELDDTVSRLDVERNKWLNIIGRPDLMNRKNLKPGSHIVCSVHFEKSRLIHKPRLHPDALPSKCLPSASPASTSTSEMESSTIDTSTQTNFAEVNFISRQNIKNAICKTSAVKTEELYVDKETQKSDNLSQESEQKQSRLERGVLKIEKEVQAKQQEDPSQSENEIKVFCPKCNTEVSHTAAAIQQDQTKILVAKVYHYFEQEYEELKTIYGDQDLTPLSKFRQRTALATGVSETTVLQILKEEEERNADKLHEPPEEQRRARKRSRQTDSSSEEDSSNDYDDGNEPSSDVHEAQTLVVKVEPPEYYIEEPEIYVPAVKLNKQQAVADPISVDVKTEPRSDVVDNTNETLALNEPAGTKRKARKIPRSDVTSTRQHTRGESSSTAAASSVRLTEELDESSLFGDTDMKTDEIEIHEEGFS